MKIKIENKDLKIEKDVNSDTGNKILGILFAGMIREVPEVRKEVTEIRHKKKPKLVEKKYLRKPSEKDTNFIEKNPELSITEISRKLGVKYDKLIYWVKKLGIRRKGRHLTPKERDNISRFIGENPQLNTHQLADKFKISETTIRRRFPREVEWAKDWRETKEVGRLYPEIPEVPLKVRAKARMWKPKEYYARTREVIRKMILSDEIPEMFSYGDVYKRIFGVTTQEDYKRNLREFQARMNLVKDAVNKLLNEGKLTLEREDDVYLHGETKSAKKKKVWRKLFKVEKEVKEEMIEPQEIQVKGELFPFTDVSRQEGIQAVRQAIHDNKLTYLKDGRFFGYDMRKMPDTRWFNLLSYVAKLIQDNKWAKDVKIDFETKGLVFT